MIDLNNKKATSIINYKKALVFYNRKKWLKPIYIGKAKSFSGYQTIAKFKTSGEEKLYIEFTQSKGYSALFLLQNGNVQIITDTNCQKTFEFQLEAGLCRLRLIGDHASLNYYVERRK
ncbi:hypothetical protein HF295_06295 [Hujiaoplasma nucleasis]|uniref:Glycosyl hydrolase family 98 putative carbohydrate-binding module domain-containing protein n=1 Tax=Hujiaoplasma nucleasis TaxID=2725268 RepID=A0A7L6N2I7_9MOLU|nr:hypothetical protein [Hujiaoplasma nucleasis]QLY40480.1 hypothetical protein HF295_06295 [Hujiaoplasma nucleasis]